MLAIEGDWLDKITWHKECSPFIRTSPVLSRLSLEEEQEIVGITHKCLY